MGLLVKLAASLLHPNRVSDALHRLQVLLNLSSSHWMSQSTLVAMPLKKVVRRGELFQPGARQQLYSRVLHNLLVAVGVLVDLPT